MIPRVCGVRPHILPALGILALGVAFTGCVEEPAEPLPTDAAIEAYYTYAGELEASMEGSVAEVRVTQPLDQVRRGGRLWAQVGPYVLLFSEPTRDIFIDHPGVTGVRVVTLTPAGEEVARAFLPRNVLTSITWDRALNIAGRARLEGTERPTLLEDLVRWGEEHTRFEYAPEFQAR